MTSLHFQKGLSLSSKSAHSRLHLSMISLGIPRGSLAFRIGKSGFKIPLYQNTYHLAPYNKYKCEVVDKILENVMNSSLKGIKYHPFTCLKLCEDMSAEVRDQIYKKSYDRYKHAVLMSIVQKLGQGVQIDWGKLWDVQRDSYSTYVFETPDFVAVGLVVAVYYE
ncbi:hypothetical protein KM043_011378 [Ampulex compressa]|nr:hypothetical protein KM043_011378 [Ampulex compressa]